MVSILSISSLSQLGFGSADVWKNYTRNHHSFTQRTYLKEKVWVGAVDEGIKQSLWDKEGEDKKYKDLDPTTLNSIIVSRAAVKEAGDFNHQMGINIGSSRGATHHLEMHHEYFLKHQKAETLASPTTTAGNLASWVANDLKSKGVNLSHSVTCSTGLHAVLNGMAWLKAGMSQRFLAGASEYPLTHFTIAQMKALKIYSRETGAFPCRALDFDKTKNTMVLGEAAAVAVLENGVSPHAIALIRGAGYGAELMAHDVSVSDDAACLQESMRMALRDVPAAEVDAVVMHAPGTVKGDMAELLAIQKVFGKNLPLLTSNKWMIGHSLGTSGLMNLELAILMLQHQEFISTPFYQNPNSNRNPNSLKNILVNSFGFGGNAVSVLLTRTTFLK